MGLGNTDKIPQRGSSVITMGSILNTRNIHAIPTPLILDCSGQPLRDPQWLLMILGTYQLAALTAMSSERREGSPYGPPLVASVSDQQKRATTQRSSQSSLFRNLSTCKQESLLAPNRNPLYNPSTTPHQPSPRNSSPLARIITRHMV